MNIPDDPRPGSTLRLGTMLRQILACLRELAQGPRVAAPLALRDGVVYYAGELRIRYGVVSLQIPNRQGRTLGKGKAILQVFNPATGQLTDDQGFNERDVFSDRGQSPASGSTAAPIVVGTLIKMYYSEGGWHVFNGDGCGATLTATARMGFLASAEADDGTTTNSTFTFDPPPDDDESEGT